MGIDGFGVTRALLYHRFDPPGVTGPEQQQRAEKAGAQSAADEDIPALPHPVLNEVSLSGGRTQHEAAPAEIESPAAAAERGSLPLVMKRIGSNTTVGTRRSWLSAERGGPCRFRWSASTALGASIRGPACQRYSTSVSAATSSA
jgi:hypothetical protein